MELYEVVLGIEDKERLEEVAEYLQELSGVNVVRYSDELVHYRYRMYQVQWEQDIYTITVVCSNYKLALDELCKKRKIKVHCMTVKKVDYINRQAYFRDYD